MSDFPVGDGIPCVLCEAIAVAYTASKPLGENAEAQRALREAWPELAEAVSQLVKARRSPPGMLPPGGASCGCRCGCPVALTEGTVMRMDADDIDDVPTYDRDPDAVKTFVLICTECYVGNHVSGAGADGERKQ